MLAYVRLNQKKYDKLGGWHIYIWPNLNGHHEALLFIFFNYHQGIIYIYIYILRLPHKRNRPVTIED
jgi:hypothetical protein